MNPSELIDAWLDGDATPEQLEQLRAWLLEDREHVRAFVRATHAHRSLREFAIAERAQMDLHEESGAERSVKASRVIGWRRWLAVGLAACVLVGVGFLYFKPRPAVSLTEVSGNVLIKRGAQTLPAASNFSLETDDVIQTPANGAAVVVFGDDGTRVNLKQNTDATFQPQNYLGSRVAGRLIQLRSGTIDAVVAKQPAGKPFVLQTEKARATVLGTELSLQADKDYSQLDVLKGSVQFEKLDSGVGFKVSTGGYARFDRASASSSHAVRTDPDGSTETLRVVDDHEGGELNWSQIPDSVPTTFELSNEQAHGGKRSLRVAYQLKPNDNDPYTQLVHPFSLHRGDRALRFSIYVATCEATANWNIQFQLRNRSCWMINFGFLNTLKPGWNEIELDLQQPPQKQVFGDPAAYAPTTAEVLIFSICNGSATFFLDDFVVVGNTP